MRIVVCVKQTVDSEALVEVLDNGEIGFDEKSLIVDPYSEFAVEKAVQIKESGDAEVVVVTIGGQEALSVIRHSLAMGADRGILLDCPESRNLDPMSKARLLSDVIKGLEPDLVMGGCKSADTASAQVMPRISSVLGFPHLGPVTALDIDAGAAIATREVEDGREVIRVDLPVVVSAQQGLADPRYPNVRSIMQSKKKPVDVLAVDAPTSGQDGQGVVPVGFRSRPKRSGGKVIAGPVGEAVAELVSLLANEAKVL